MVVANIISLFAMVITTHGNDYTRVIPCTELLGT